MSSEMKVMILRAPSLEIARLAAHNLLVYEHIAPYSAQLMFADTNVQSDIAMAVMNTWGDKVEIQATTLDGKEFKTGLFQPNIKVGKFDKLAVVESPYRTPKPNHLRKNINYLNNLIMWCYCNGYAPVASHKMYTQEGVLNDNLLAERELGILAGLAVAAYAQFTIVGTDRGMSEGMKKYGIPAAEKAKRTIIYTALAR